MVLRTFWIPAVSLALGMFLQAPTASAGAISLGSAANYAVISGPENSFSYNGAGSINGNVAIGQDSSINWATPATITGTVYEDTSGSGIGTTNNITPTGGFVTNDASVEAAVTAATQAAASAGALTATINMSQISITNPTGDVTINADDNANGQTVVDVAGINITNGTLTLNGDGANDVFIINVLANGGNADGITLSAACNIVLTGGLTANNVLFNVEGSGNAVNINGGSTSYQALSGTLLVLSGNVSVHDDTMTGAIYALNSLNNGASIQDTSGFNLNYDAFGPTVAAGHVPEPATLTLLGMGISGLLAARKRKKL